MTNNQATKPSPVTVDTTALNTMGFTPSGLKHFRETVLDYSQQLLERAVHRGDADKAQGMEREITHDHVRASAHSIARSFGAPLCSKWLVVAQVGEYLSTAAAGVGGGHLDKPWGIICFALGVSMAVILVVVRLTRGKGD
ncbi:hypothetical protein HYR99_35870 [Candidatus Poribacteria bacterium]|nr:hypothetical protein [Candidatus Poribacteria bacterium]